MSLEFPFSRPRPFGGCSLFQTSNFPSLILLSEIQAGPGQAWISEEGLFLRHARRFSRKCRSGGGGHLRGRNVADHCGCGHGCGLRASGFSRRQGLLEGLPTDGTARYFFCRYGQSVLVQARPGACMGILWSSAQSVPRHDASRRIRYPPALVRKNVPRLFHLHLECRWSVSEGRVRRKQRPRVSRFDRSPSVHKTLPG